MGSRLVYRKTSVVAFLALAALAHGTFDALLSTDGAQVAATVLVLALATCFFVMLRRALRHGAVQPRSRPSREAIDEPRTTEPVPVSSLPRTYFRVGAPGAFLACAAGMVVCAFAVTVLGSAYELLHHRAGVVFVALATAMLGLFGLAAYGASATIPLDIAIDAWGLTFAGGRTPWTEVLGAEVDEGGRTRRTRRAMVEIRTRSGVLRLGPTTLENARAIVAACSRPLR
jgi:hypothetical protein